MDGDLAGPRNRSRTAPAGWAALLRSPWWRPGPPRRGAGSRRSAHRPQARPGPRSRRSSARSGVCRRSKVGNHLCPIRVLRLSLTTEVATWPNRPPVTPASVPCPASRHLRTAAAWPRRCRRIRRGRSGPGTGGDRLRSTCRLAWRRPSASWPPPSGAPDRSACRCSLWWSTTAARSRCRRGWTATARPASPWFRPRLCPPTRSGPHRHAGPGAGDPTRLASIVGAGFSLAGPSGDASQKPSQPSGGKQ